MRLLRIVFGLALLASAATFGGSAFLSSPAAATAPHVAAVQPNFGLTISQPPRLPHAQPSSPSCLTTVNVYALPALVHTNQPTVLKTTVHELQLGVKSCNVAPVLQYFGLPASCVSSSSFLLPCQTSVAGSYDVTVIAVLPWGNFASQAAALTVVP